MHTVDKNVVKMPVCEIHGWNLKSHPRQNISFQKKISFTLFNMTYFPKSFNFYISL